VLGVVESTLASQVVVCIPALEEEVWAEAWAEVVAGVCMLVWAGKFALEAEV